MVSRDDTCVGMDWNGFEGYLYYIKKYEGIDLVFGTKQLSIPTTMEELDSFQETLLELYEMKAFLVKYNHFLDKHFVNAEDFAVYHTP